MNVADICTHRVVSVPVGAPLTDAVALMYGERVGTVIVTRMAASHPIVVGILTDHDVVHAQLNRIADFSALSVADAMTLSPLVVQATDELTEVLERLRARRIRRAPVVDEFGSPVGLISTDDLLQHLARQISALADVVASQAGSPA